MSDRLVRQSAARRARRFADPPRPVVVEHAIAAGLAGGQRSDIMQGMITGGDRGSGILDEAAGGADRLVGSDGFLREAPIQHRLAEHYADLRAIRTRKQLLGSPLWAAIGAEVERVTAALERADHTRAVGPRWPDRLRVVAWNIRRGTHLEAIAEALAGDPTLAEADVLLLSEVDHGMARSGNRHVARELAARLGMSYAYGVSYVALEDDIGENPERHPNGLALAGAAVLSRVPLGRVESVDLPELRDKFSSSEKRLGRKRALAAEVLLADGPLVVAAAHLDSNASPRGRARQLAALLDSSLVRGAERLLLGGDLNTTTYDASSTAALMRDLVHKLVVTGFRGTVDNYMTPERLYDTPVFAALAAAGLTIDGFNDRSRGTIVYDMNDAVTIAKVRQKVGGWLARWLVRRLRPWGGVVSGRLDWFAGRGVRPVAAAVIPPPRSAPSARGGGEPASDHAAITVDLALGQALRQEASPMARRRPPSV